MNPCYKHSMITLVPTLSEPPRPSEVCIALLYHQTLPSSAPRSLLERPRHYHHLLPRPRHSRSKSVWLPPAIVAVMFQRKDPFIGQGIVFETAVLVDQLDGRLRVPRGTVFEVFKK